VRDFTKLGLMSDSQLLSMAAIVHDCYQSCDLSLRLLLECDRRNGTKFGEIYLSGLHRSQHLG
jgi:hypothetical protein